MHLPQDCADLSTIDWTPLADTASTPDNPTAKPRLAAQQIQATAETPAA